HQPFDGSEGVLGDFPAQLHPARTGQGPLAHGLAVILREPPHNDAPRRFGALRLQRTARTGARPIFPLPLRLGGLEQLEDLTCRAVPAVALPVVAEPIAAEILLSLRVDPLGMRHDRLDAVLLT